jgi:transforming growth factor-beta-induced protein
MRTLTLGIALSALVGSLALAQTGTTGGTGSSKKNPTATPGAAGTATTAGSTGSTSNVAKSSGRTIAQTVASNDSFNTLESLLGQAGLTGTFSGNGSYTVFAPTDAAFEMLGAETLAMLNQPENKAKLTAILSYHVVPGLMGSSQFTSGGGANTLNGQRLGLGGSNGNWTVGQVTITKTDIQCSNGVIHVIDAVLTPTESNLVEVAGGSGNFSTFLKACKAAGLDSMLVKNGNYTVFAPTDEAFAKLPAGTLEMLMLPENRNQLREILSYHVVPGNRWFSTELGGRSELPTASGQTLQVESSGGTMTLANGSVVNSDLQATNGVLHGVDRVLLPGSPNRPATVKSEGGPLKGTTATGKDRDSD